MNNLQAQDAYSIAPLTVATPPEQVNAIVQDSLAPGSSTVAPSVNAVNTALASKADIVNGTVPAAQLPSYVDDVIEATSFSTLPATGESGKIYVTLDTNLSYRWSGSLYVEISKTLDESNLVHKSGDESISGKKTFTSAITAYWSENNLLESPIYLGDLNHSIRAVGGIGVKIGSYGVVNGIVLRQVSGNVGIGTASPTEMLEVNGNIKTDRVIIGAGSSTVPSLTFSAPGNNPIAYGSNQGIGLSPAYEVTMGIGGSKFQVMNSANSIVYTLNNIGAATFANTVTATGFIGDGSQLTNLPNNGITIDSLDLVQDTYIPGLPANFAGLTPGENATFYGSTQVTLNTWQTFASYVRSLGPGSTAIITFFGKTLSFTYYDEPSGSFTVTKDGEPSSTINYAGLSYFVTKNVTFDTVDVHTVTIATTASVLSLGLFSVLALSAGDSVAVDRVTLSLTTNAQTFTADLTPLLNTGVVHIGGDETITGVKTFNNGITFADGTVQTSKALHKRGNGANSVVVIGGSSAAGNYATISGGESGSAGGDYATNAGGAYNNAAGVKSVVSGGHNNLSYGTLSGVACGYNNQAWGDYAFVSNGQNNTVYGAYSTASGDNNFVNGDHCHIHGGFGNSITGCTRVVFVNCTNFSVSSVTDKTYINNELYVPANTLHRSVTAVTFDRSAEYDTVFSNTFTVDDSTKVVGVVATIYLGPAATEPVIPTTGYKCISGIYVAGSTLMYMFKVGANDQIQYTITNLD